MEKEQIQSVLDKIHFLNFRFEVDFIMKDMIHIRIVAFMPNNDDRSKRSDMTSFHRFSINECKNELDLLKSVFINILEKMRHEASEIFSFDGKTIFNEHWDLSDEKKSIMIQQIMEN